MEAATLAMACSPEEHCLHRMGDLSAAAGSHCPLLTGRLWATAQAVSGRPHSHVGMVASRLAQNQLRAGSGRTSRLPFPRGCVVARYGLSGKGRLGNRHDEAM